MSRECLADSPDQEDEDHDIDQFNEDTFGDGALEDWDDRGEGSVDVEDVFRGRCLAERLERLVVEGEMEEPVTERPQHNTIPAHNPGLWDGPSMFHGMANPFLAHLEDVRLGPRSRVSPLLPNPPEGGRDLSDRAPPPRSTSPVIGSPPVRTAPIGTPPKHYSNMANQRPILCPTPIHIRAQRQQNYPMPFNDPRTPTHLLHAMNSTLHSHHLQGSVSQPLLLGSAQSGRLSPGHFAQLSSLVRPSLSAVQSNLRLGPLVPPLGGFRPFFSGSASARMHPLGPQPTAVRVETTHLHPQHWRLLNQRLQLQNVSSQQRGLNGSGGPRNSRGCFPDQAPKDPYSNLMTQREKEWVTKIQIMQLQGADPSLDDYYYQNYFERLERRETEVEPGGEGPRRERTRLITPQLGRLEHAYRPVQFEGSLGKLTISSVNNPRKMIDAVVTTRTEDDETKERQVRDRRRQTLFTIEKTFSLLLEVQDVEHRFLSVAERDRESLLELRRAKIAQIYANLRGKPPASPDRLADDHFVQVMSIRKGKCVTGRSLALLPIELAAELLLITARNLPLLTKRDTLDQVLPSLTEPCTRVINHLPSAHLTELLRQLRGVQRGQLPHVLQSKFGLTLFYAILSQGERLQSSDGPGPLMQDNRWTELVFGVTRELLLMPPSSLATPTHTPDNLRALFSQYVDRQRLTVLEDKLQLPVDPR